MFEWWFNSPLLRPFRQMMEFTASVRSWLEADDKNIIAVHCKGKKLQLFLHFLSKSCFNLVRHWDAGGKGRTGTMVCVWLVEAGLFSKAEDSLCYFGARRTDTLLGHTFQGVETPSQVPLLLSFCVIIIDYMYEAHERMLIRDTPVKFCLKLPHWPYWKDILFNNAFLDARHRYVFSKAKRNELLHSEHYGWISWVDMFSHNFSEVSCT